LRRDPLTAATPVIMLTARAHVAGASDGIAAHYLAKPFSPQRFAGLVEQLLATRNRRPESTGLPADAPV
jgi:DNA-binding response OmpR family regulator